MKKILCEQIGHIPPAGFAVCAGTSGHKIGIAECKNEHVYDLTSAEDRLPILAVDAAGITTSFRVPLVDSSLDDIGLDPNELLAAGLPDGESLQKAEREGKLWRMDPGWYKEPGVIKDNQGTGGNPRKGHGLAALNENRIRKKIRRHIRDCGDYQHQRRLMNKGNNKGTKDMAITVVVCLSLLGGCATGMLRTLLRIIREESLDLKVPVKIIVLALTKGSIEPADGEVAARNQSMALRELNAALVGGYQDADHDPRINQPLCDSLLLISNRNNWGEFNDLDRLIAVAGQFLEALTAELAKFASANRRKLEVAQSKKKSIDDLLGRAHEMLNRLKKRFWLFRALSFSTKREIARVIPPATESAIRNRLEIAARLCLANEVYPAIQKYVSQQQASVHHLVNNVTAVMTDIGGEAGRLRTAEPVLLVPLGHEVVNKAFIDGRYAKIVDAEGGLEQVFEKMFAEYIGHYKNLLAFNYVELGQIKKTLLEYCLGTSHRHLGTLRVGEVFRESCQSPREIKDRVDQSIRESQGRLRLVGEADEIIPTMKFIGVGDRATGEWIARGQRDRRHQR